jgi:predicted phage-related endonuclease
MSIERVEITSRDQWLNLRKSDVTASVVAALFGAHPYTSALKLYLAHSGVEFDQADDRVLRRGRLMEPAVALAVSEERPDWKIEKCDSYYRDPELHLGATPDFFIHGDPRGLGVLQTKTAAPHIFERDWEGGATVPFWIQLQVLTEAMLTKAAFGAVAVLRVDAFDLALALIEVPRHPAAEQRIKAAVVQFWDDIATRREPDADYNRDAELLKVIAPHEVAGTTVDLSGDNELPALLEQREEIMTGIKGFEARKDEIETMLKFKMRDASSVVGLPEWNVTWKSVLRNEFTVPAKEVRTLRITRKKSAAP